MHTYEQNNLDNLLFKLNTVKTKVVFQEKSDILSRPFSNHLRKKEGGCFSNYLSLLLRVNIDSVKLCSCADRYIIPY